MNDRALVCVVDDDESVRDSLLGLLHQFGFNAQAFSSGLDFFASEVVDQTSCLILDVAMPDVSGPDLYQELRRRGKPVPVIFITAQVDACVRQQLLARGASECLFKPFNEGALLHAVDVALQSR